MNTSKEVLLKRLQEIDRRAVLLAEASAVLSWDQEVNLPQEAGEVRAEQISLLTQLAHDCQTSDEVEALLTDLGSTSQNPGGTASSGLTQDESDYLRYTRRNYDREKRLPSEHVAEFSRVTSQAQVVWARARSENNFALFKPWLKKIVALEQQAARYLQDDVKNLYDVLLDLYEPGVASADLDVLFNQSVPFVADLVQRIYKKNPHQPAVLNSLYPVEVQDRFACQVMRRIGYDASRGHLAISAHPFTTRLGAADIRITTNYDEKNLLSGLFSVIHESGHAMYEQNIDKKLYGLSIAQGVSMGIHESQSRLWENMIGRSRSFWQCFYPEMQKFFPDAFSDMPLEQWYRAVNYVKPSHIRVAADEVSYTLHIVLRYRLEKALISGAISVDQVQDAWRQESKLLLGIEPQTDAEGVLQDVHWSCGSFGYFPSYALGNFYGAQFKAAMEKALPSYEEDIMKGNFTPVQNWLAEHVWKYGARKFPSELLYMATGQKLSCQPFLDYLTKKYQEFV